MFSLRNILKKFKKDKNEEQEITQQDGYEILEVTQLSVFKTIQIYLKDFFKVRNHIIVTIVCGCVFVMAVAGTVITVTSVNHRHKEKNVIAAVDNTVVQMETKEALKTSTMSLYLEAVADENTITASVYDEDGEILTGHNLVFNLLKGSKEDNEVQVEKLKGTYAGQSIEDIETQVYDDDDKDGTVFMPDLETGVYTLVVQAEEGYETPDAAEATVETFEVMDDIMNKVVDDSALTQQEDPFRNRADDSVDDPIPETTATSGEIKITTLKKSGDNIIYKINSKKSVQYSDTEIAKFKTGSVVIDQNGSLSTYSGYVYETGSVEVTGGKVSVITKFLVPSSDISVEKAENVENVTTLLVDVPKKKETESETETQDSTKSESTSESDSETKQETKTDEASKPTESQSTEAKKNYTLLTIEAETETSYADGWQTIDGKTYYFADSKAVTGWYKIGSMQYYFNSDGTLGSSLVIDVSTYNGDINWSQVKAAGIDYAMIRVGYRGYETAKLVKDKRFDDNMKNATAAGVKVGAYIVTQAVNTNEAVEEASFIISACKSYSVSLPLAIDVESAGNGTGRGDKISVSERTAVINAFVQTVKNSGYSAMVYANKDWMTNKINAGSLVSGSNVWLAQYRSSCTYGGSYQMWQFTDSGSVSGITGHVDVSAWKH